MGVAGLIAAPGCAARPRIASDARDSPFPYEDARSYGETRLGLCIDYMVIYDYMVK